MSQDIKDISGLLKDRAEDFATSLLGAPTKRSRGELRYGKKGSLSVGLSGKRKGLFTDFQENESGDMISLYQHVMGSSIGEAINYAKGYLGIDGTAQQPRQAQSLPREKDQEKQEQAEKEEEKKRLWLANKLWEDSVKAKGTQAEAYLKTRNIDILPDSVRYWEPKTDRDLKFLSNNTQIKKSDRIGALIIPAYNENGTLMAVQRIFLQDGKKTTLMDPVKRTNGIMRGASVRFTAPSSKSAKAFKNLVLAEGPETALSLHQASLPDDSHPGYQDTQIRATLGTSNLATAEIPDNIKTLTIAAERDNSGAGIGMALKAAAHWQRTRPDLNSLMLSVADDGDHQDVHQKQGIEGVRDNLKRNTYKLTKKPLKELSETAIWTNDPDAAIAFWSKTGAEVVFDPSLGTFAQKPNGENFTKPPRLPDHVKRVIIPIGQEFAISPDALMGQIGGLKRNNIDVRMSYFGEGSLAEAIEDEKIIENMCLYHTPFGKRAPVGIHSMANTDPGKPVLITDRAATMDAGKKLFPECDVIAPWSKTPSRTDWSKLKDRDTIIATPYSPEGFIMEAKIAGELHDAGVTRIRSMVWPREKFDDVKLKAPDLNTLLDRGWTREDIKENNAEPIGMEILC